MGTQVSNRLTPTLEWPSFSKEKSKNTIKKCNSSFTPEPDYILMLFKNICGQQQMFIEFCQFLSQNELLTYL